MREKSGSDHIGHIFFSKSIIKCTIFFFFFFLVVFFEFVCLFHFFKQKFEIQDCRFFHQSFFKSSFFFQEENSATLLFCINFHTSWREKKCRQMIKKLKELYLSFLIKKKKRNKISFIITGIKDEMSIRSVKI